MQSSVPINRPPCSIDSSQLRCVDECVGTASFPRSSSTRPLRCFDDGALSRRGATQSATKRQLEEPEKVNKKTIDEATPSTLYVDFHPSGRPTRLQQQHQQSTRRCVRFAPRLHEERDHIARADMSESEVLACWYDEIDLRELQMDTVATVRDIRQLRAERPEPAFLLGGRADCRGLGRERDLDRRGILSPRGLEHVIDPIVLARRRAVRDDVAGAVLTEQEAVRILTEERAGLLRVVPRSDESIARASAEASRSSAERAAAAALEDASAAREIARERSRDDDDGNDGGKKRLVDLLLRSAF